MVTAALREAELSKTNPFAVLQIVNKGQDAEAAAVPDRKILVFLAYARRRGQDSASAAVNRRIKKWGIRSKSFRRSLKDRLREVGCPKDIRDAIQGHENGEVAEVYGLGHTLKTMQDWLEKAKVVI